MRGATGWLAGWLARWLAEGREFNMSSGPMAGNHCFCQLRPAPHLVAPHEGVALPSDLHVLIPVQHDAHGAAQVVGGDGAGGVEEAGARLLAAKAAACTWGAGRETEGAGRMLFKTSRQQHDAPDKWRRQGGISAGVQPSGARWLSWHSPRRLVRTTTLLMGTPSTWLMYFWCLSGHCSTGRCRASERRRTRGCSGPKPMRRKLGAPKNATTSLNATPPTWVLE